MTSPNNNGIGALMAPKQVTIPSENLSQGDTEDNRRILAKLSGSDFEYWIKKDKVTIGRNSSHGKVDVNVEMSSYISRKHLQIIYERGRFFLHCLGKNGVFVNGQFQRLGANPVPLDKACFLRFPSTSIQLNFDPHPPEVNITNGDSAHISVQSEAKISFSNDNQVKPGATNLSVPTLIHSKSLSPNSMPPVEPKEIKPEQEFSSPSLKYMLPKDHRGFLSAPPSPTGTISAMNSCPASPRSGTPHFLNQNNNVAENLSAAAAVLEKRDVSGDGIDSKPPYSYAQLIIQAISSAPKRQLTLSGIYAHITKHYPYYRTADKGWQNSIRHNLSLNRYFVKVPRSQEESGKGSFWRVDPASERKLVEQAWRKRRQRAVPCFCSSAVISGVSTLTRSAPVSPEHSNPISPVSAIQGVISSSQEDHSSLVAETDGKVQFVHFTTRYAQSAPGSPASIRHGVAMTTVGDSNALNRSVQQPTTILAPASSLPLSDSKRNQVIWPLHAAAQAAVTQSPIVQAAIIKTDKNKETGDAQSYNAKVIDASKITSVVHVPSTTTISLSTIATFTPQQHQLIQQSATLPHQVVMVPGQGPQRVQQAIPINVGTLVATPNNLVSSGIPFVVPVNQQQYIVRRASDDTTSEPAAKKLKQEDSNSNVKSNE